MIPAGMAMLMEEAAKELCEARLNVSTGWLASPTDGRSIFTLS